MAWKLQPLLTREESGPNLFFHDEEAQPVAGERVELTPKNVFRVVCTGMVGASAAYVCSGSARMASLYARGSKCIRRNECL